MANSSDRPTIDKTPDTNSAKGDYSLRANGDTYRDRDKETERISRRLLNSSGSVTGISGKRGAGKSSLAMSVLGRCHEKGAFTQVIQSPTRYDSREFVVSLFQRICEEVVLRIDEKFKQRISLVERGNQERRRLTRNLFLWFASIFFVAFFGFAPLNYLLGPQLLQNQIQFLSNAADSRFEALEEMAIRINSDAVSDDLESIRSGNRDPNTLELSQRDMNQLTISSSDQLEDIELYLAIRSDLLSVYRDRQRIEDGGSIELFLPTSVDGDMLIPATLAILMPLLLLFAIRRILRLLREIYLRSKYRLFAGLRNRALDHLEHLKFQTTFATSKEGSFSAMKLATSFSSEKSLAARPLSLSGLTAQMVQFLDDLHHVYPEGVVICIDELDKIDDPRDLYRVLRGLKGVLGHQHTHFLLTVSDDALAKFAAQRGLEQGILESAFEDIVVLDHVDLKGADYIVDLMFKNGHSKNGNDSVPANTVLLWLFGAGIPREIKRNALVFFENDVHPEDVCPTNLWKKLFQSRLDDMESWVLHIGGSDQSTEAFLSALDGSRKILGRNDEDVVIDRQVGKQLVDIWVGQFGPVIVCDANDDDSSTLVVCAVLQILLGLSGLAYVDKNDPIDMSDEFMEQVVAIAQIIPVNIVHAARTMDKYLSDTKLLAGSQSLNRTSGVISI